MDTFVNEKDFELLSGDRYTFSVLTRILGEKCELILSDHRRLILCHSEAPWPVWIWTPDGITEDEKEQAWKLAEEYRPLSAGNRYNMKYELADYFIARCRESGMDAGYAMRLFAYDCPVPVAPDVLADGSLYRCTQQDLEEATALFLRFGEAVGEDIPSPEHALRRTRLLIDNGTLFFWKDAAGQVVACCSYRVIGGNLASLGSVYTLPEYRRKHYAQHMVWQVTRMVSDAGYVPMLYTDADYAASNACYEKIGYVLRGKLCTLAASV